MLSGITIGSFINLITHNKWTAVCYPLKRQLFAFSFFAVGTYTLWSWSIVLRMYHVLDFANTCHFRFDLVTLLAPLNRAYVYAHQIAYNQAAHRASSTPLLLHSSSRLSSDYLDVSCTFTVPLSPALSLLSRPVIREYVFYRSQNGESLALSGVGMLSYCIHQLEDALAVLDLRLRRPLFMCYF